MIDILAANAERTEQQDRPTADSVRAAREAGAFALATPEVYGGRSANATEIARTLTGMGRACPATSWIAGTCLTAKTLAGGYDETVLKELFADPDALFCGTGVPSGRGETEAHGVRVNGRWVSVSGCEDAQWAGLALMVDGVFSFAQIPLADLSIDRTWQMAGMRGTGSHTVVAEDVLVPAGRVTPFKGPFGVATMQLFAISVLAPMVGATFGALDVITAMFASDRKPYMTAYANMGASPGARQWLAEATTLAQRAERTMLAVATEIDAGTGLTDADGSRLHLNLSEAARDCRASVELMLDLHGTSGFRTSNPLQRFWRDVAVGSRHPHLNAYLAVEGFGRTVAGVTG
ncbi:acyl-CoA dehydrogenase family protein [Actinoplanes sp. NPDC051494]|uniref:acyl-CoA dehydrogenase family protein n=1 Tax=Actinoplanes sp. NPDC051494 TaxID=3363907 RepID=UPI0037AFDF0B